MKLWKILGVELYEVGDIFINMSGNNPGNRFKGTWSLIAQGRTLVGVDTSQSEFNSVRKSGGAKTHKLTVAELASHTHIMTNENPADKSIVGVGVGERTGTGNGIRPPVTYWASNTFSGYLNTVKSGSDQAHNNLQPYLTTYIWERVS